MTTITQLKGMIKSMIKTESVYHYYKMGFKKPAEIFESEKLLKAKIDAYKTVIDLIEYIETREN